MFIIQHLNGGFGAVLLLCLYFGGYVCILKSMQMAVTNNGRPMRNKKAVFSIGMLMLACVPFLYSAFFIAMQAPDWSLDDKAKDMAFLTCAGLFLLIVAAMDLRHSKSKKQKKICAISFAVTLVFLLAIILMLFFTIRCW